jgi:hypothetical protein
MKMARFGSPSRKILLPVGNLLAENRVQSTKGQEKGTAFCKNMIKVHEAESVLRNMLQTAKVDLHAPDIELFWSVYKEFANISVAVESNPDDALLFQWGTSRFPNDSRQGFYLDFTRQFCINDEDGEYDHMQQLSAALLYAEPMESSLGASNFWSYAFDNSFKQFIEAVENSAAFKKMRTDYHPFRLDIMQECV